MTAIQITTPAKPRGNPAWTPGGPSPNPSGRPRGIQDRRQKVQAALTEDAPAVARVVLNAALEGDLQACALVLARVAPTLRSQAQTVTFAFDPAAPVSRQVEMVLAGVASGDLPADVGKQVIDAIQSLSVIRTAEDLEARIALLEEREQ